jgi:hypothetical protein
LKLKKNKVELLIFYHQEWEYVKETCGYKLCVNSNGKKWSFLLFNIASVVSKSTGFSSRKDAIKNGIEKAKKINKERNDYIVEIEIFFKNCK